MCLGNRAISGIIAYRNAARHIRDLLVYLNFYRWILLIMEVAMSNIHLQIVQSIIDDYIDGNGAGIHILDAGCGSSVYFDRYFNFPDTVRISGIDTSQEALAKNNTVHEKILGDIQTYSTDRRYDIVICWDVLEHLENPKKALSNLLAWTKQNGILIIRVPNIFSLKGLLTKFTPYWFHKWICKNIFRFRVMPNPTYLRFFISPKSLLNYFAQNTIEYESFATMSLSGCYNYFYGFIIVVIKLLTLGKYHPEFAEYYLVVRNTIKNESSDFNQQSSYI